jgi:hypothetical protein
MVCYGGVCPAGPLASIDAWLVKDNLHNQLIKDNLYNCVNIREIILLCVIIEINYSCYAYGS